MHVDDTSDTYPVLEITVGHRPFSEHILNLTDRLLVYSAIWPTEILCYDFISASALGIIHIKRQIVAVRVNSSLLETTWDYRSCNAVYKATVSLVAIFFSRDITRLPCFR